LQEWQKNMQDSIAYALQIQTAMLQFDTKNLQYFHSYFILWLPRDVVSGDFYYIRQIEHQIFVAAVDCTGHGVPGAFMSVLGINLLDEIIINQQHYEPQNILLHLHTRIQRALRQQQTNNRDGMDLALIRLDTHTHEITYAGAKNPLLIIHNQEAIYLKPDRFSIGGDSIKQNLVFQQQTLSLQKGMRLFLFSDGLADQFGGEENKKFTFANLKQLLLTTSNYPLEEQKQKILHSFTSWKADYPQTDDVLLIGLEV
ncbi:MAG: serine/threonine-protein phosphatase, partial [Microscillaceae bacterium]|nr:serine/threonine-protein phosphatase [Microscillaceae bacterium]MDW8461078.1 SpoIIE family protein phosphatase [Cytophagales bacterium]